MAVSMLVLVVTAFFPVIGLQFAWVEWHWMAGILLTGSILFHIVHATFFLDFWSIWVGPKDIPEFKAEMMREFGKEPDAPEAGQIPAGQPALSPGGDDCRPGGHRHGHPDDVPRPQSDHRGAQPVPA